MKVRFKEASFSDVEKNLSGSGWGLVSDPCEHGNGLSGSITGMEFD